MITNHELRLKELYAKNKAQTAPELKLWSKSKILLFRSLTNWYHEENPDYEYLQSWLVVVN